MPTLFAPLYRCSLISVPWRAILQQSGEAAQAGVPGQIGITGAFFFREEGEFL